MRGGSHHGSYGEVAFQSIRNYINTLLQLRVGLQFKISLKSAEIGLNRVGENFMQDVFVKDA